MSLRNRLRRLLCLSATLAAILLARPGAAQQSSGAAVQGVVMVLRTGQPVEGACVYLLDTAVNEGRITPQPSAMVLTNNKGEFVFENLDAATYRVIVTSGGFVKRESPALVLHSSQRMKDMVFRLTPTGNISGTVRDGSGKALTNVTVTLLRPHCNADGTRSFGTAGTAQTNDLGEYRMFWITPGKYYVMAGGGIAWLSGDIQSEFDNSVKFGRNGVSDSYTQVFFPGVTELSKAALVDLQEEAELRGIDLTLFHQKRYSVRGRLIDSTTGIPIPDAWFTLTQRELNGHGVMEPADFDAKTGEFEFSLPPGRYLLSGWAPEIGPYASYSQPFVPWAEREVTIDNASVDIELSLAVRPVIIGQIRVEGSLPVGTSLVQLKIDLTPVDSSPPLRFENPSANSDDTGKFLLAAQQNGSYRVTASGLPDGFYLKDALLNETDVLNGSSEFSSSGTLKVVIGDGAASIDGRVIDEQMRPAIGIEAVLIPDNHRNRAELFKRAVTDHEGRFHISNVAPGDYKILAWENIEANSYFDENVMTRFEQKGTRVHVTQSSRVTVEVTRIPEEATP